MIEVAAAVIIKENQVFLASRPENKPPAGWEFPGGKLEKGETPFDAVKRELMEELSWPVIPQKLLYTMKNEQLNIYFILCSVPEDHTPCARENQQFKWVDLKPELPHGLLKNDTEFWNFLAGNKIIP